MEGAAEEYEQVRQKQTNDPPLKRRNTVPATDARQSNGPLQFPHATPALDTRITPIPVTDLSLSRLPLISHFNEICSGLLPRDEGG